MCMQATVRQLKNDILTRGQICLQRDSMATRSLVPDKDSRKGLRDSAGKLSSRVRNAASHL